MSRLRLGGLVLVGLAIVLAVVGVLSLRGGADTASDDPVAVLPSTTTAAPTTTVVPTTTLTTTTTPPPTTAPPSATVPPTTAPTTTTTAPAPPTTTAAPVVDPRRGTQVVVLNNSTTTGLAARAAAAVRGDGWTVSTVGNLTGRTPTTTVYYPSGQLTAARALAADVGADQVQARSAGLDGFGSGLVLVVTSDFAG